jgi:hypothetical protein
MILNPLNHVRDAASRAAPGRTPGILLLASVFPCCVQICGFGAGQNSARRKRLVVRPAVSHPA